MWPTLLLFMMGWYRDQKTKASRDQIGMAKFKLCNVCKSGEFYLIKHKWLPVLESGYLDYLSHSSTIFDKVELHGFYPGSAVIANVEIR